MVLCEYSDLRVNKRAMEAAVPLTSRPRQTHLGQAGRLRYQIAAR